MMLLPHSVFTNLSVSVGERIDSYISSFEFVTYPVEFTYFLKENINRQFKDEGFSSLPVPPYE